MPAAGSIVLTVFGVSCGIDFEVLGQLEQGCIGGRDGYTFGGSVDIQVGILIAHHQKGGIIILADRPDFAVLDIVEPFTNLS